jgi:5-methylthioribose kinase
VIEGSDTPWVVKTPLAKLTVDDEWLVDRERGANEALILELLGGRLGPVRTPRLLFFDESNVVLGQEFFAPPTANYKDELLAGRSHPDVAHSIGVALGILHRIEPPLSLSGGRPRQLFDDLRLDPYYRTAALRCPELREELESLVQRTIAVAQRSLVHGDLSPKNVLVTSEAPVLLDWEVIHVGDPAFDRGMMGAHLMLKAVFHDATTTTHPLAETARQFWLAYEGPASVGESLRHLGGVMIARLYGKSPVEYLTDELKRARAHRIGAMALRGEIRTVDELLESLTEDRKG